MRKVKWGVLGTAGILGATAPGMKVAEHCEMYAIAGRNAEKVAKYQEQYGFEKGYLSYDELLADAEVEAVYIPLPNDLHYEWTLKALKSGKHVLCEKPIAVSEAQAKKMFAAAKENNVLLMEAFAYQHSPFMEALSKEVSEGVIGDVRYIETAFITSDYDDSNIRMQYENYGGCTYDLGVYTTSFLLRVMGEEPEDLTASAIFSDGGVDVLTHGMISYASGAKGTFTCGMALATEQSKRFDRFEISGTKGAIHSIDFEYNKQGSMSYELEIFGQGKTVKTLEVADNYGLEVEQLSKCILGEDTPYVTEDFSLKNARFIDRILDEIGYKA